MSNNFNTQEKSRIRPNGRFRSQNDATNMSQENCSANESLLNGSVESSWDEMLNEFNSIEQDSTAFSGNNIPVPTDSQLSNSSKDNFSDGFEDELNDDFDNDLSNDFDSQSGDGFDNSFADDLGSGFDDDFADDSSDEKISENENAVSASRTNPAKHNNTNNSSNKGLAGRIVIVLVALAFGIGVLFAVKLSNGSSDSPAPDNADNFGSVSHSDKADNTVSSAPAVESEDVSSADVSSEQEYTELRYGDNSDDVLKMQKRLCELGYIAETSCTGFFGKYTRSKIKEFQKASGMEQTGIADSATLARLYSDNAPKAG